MNGESKMTKEKEKENGGGKKSLRNICGLKTEIFARV